MEKTIQSRCLQCGKTLTGRSDKLYCNEGCKDDYHNQRRSRYRAMRLPYLKTLDRNYQLLKSIMSTDEKSIQRKTMDALGFDASIFTSLLGKGNNYIDCSIFDISYRLTPTKITSLKKLASQEALL